jgi:rhodanese-related sulfurtransferase/DNA-binding transcriptional ArsR family regulator
LNTYKPSTAQRLARSHYGELARIGKVLSSPVRLQLLDLLRQGSRNVESLAEAAGVSVANSSQHLQQMRSARLVAAERQGQRVEYRLADQGVSEVFGALRGLAEALLPEMDRLRRELSVQEPEAREELLSRIRRGEAMLLDVRPAEEYRAGHLPGARCIPLPELGARLHELPRDREVVAYCRGPYCPMASEAVALLMEAGYRARHLDLGVPDLRARRIPIASGDEGPAPLPPRRSPRGDRSSPNPKNLRKHR